MLDSLPRTVPHRRAALLAAGDMSYKAGSPVTDYAPGLMRLDDKVLEEVARLAHNFALAHPSIPEHPMAEDERVRYLAEIKVVAQDVESDEDLSPTERRHVKSLIQELLRALEAAPQDGARPVETAAKAVLGDVALNRGLWQRLSPKPWMKRLGRIAVALSMLVSFYSDGKELVADASAWFGQPLAIIAEQHHPQPRMSEVVTSDENEIHDAETVPEDDTDEPR
ncbi:hypothetical protein H5398_03320 [Tessaracoccus sp. MC1679]|uniref:hypothetical protein n=1 Tax=Tessaracoccus sp. MC1679 TaxID=2760313 RepID=UPI001603ECF7|nr:hypothetical protein [Tessaracoccus sp. MC1679]MBB1515009.1 hypothetical protein [Tessaracoccus sp. MC1679]